MQKENRTQRKYQAQISLLENLYISPLESCNLRCRYCYTPKTKSVLTNRQILGFIRRYQPHVPIKSIIFCGGEVFTLPSFPKLINQIHSQGIFTTIITNGTIDRLTEINHPNSCQLLVSFDGPEAIHDHNRGPGNYQKSIAFTRHALDLGFHVEIFFLVTAESYPYRHTFNILGLPQTYLLDRLGSLSPSEALDIWRHFPTYPPKVFGCHQISLQSDGFVYPCCETNRKIGQISDKIDTTIDNYLSLVSRHPLCVDPNFQCHLPPKIS